MALMDRRAGMAETWLADASLAYHNMGLVYREKRNCSVSYFV
jgi:hypothetical protein